MGSLLLLGLTFLSPVVLLVCKFFVDSVSYGYSGAKTRLLLLFFALLLGLQAAPSFWKARWNRLYIIALAILHISAVGAQLSYSRIFTVSPWDFTILVAGGNYSSTSLLHIHSAKLPAAYLTRYAGQGFDSGSPFLTAFSGPVPALHSLGFVLVACLSFLVVHQRSLSLSLGRTLSLALAVFVLTKNGIDGGPFSVNTLVAVPFVGGLLWGEPGAKRGVGLALLGALPGLLGADSSYVNGFFLNGLLTAAALGLPLCVDRFRAGESKRGGIWGGLCVIALLGIPTWRYATYDFFRGPPHTLGTLAYGLRTVEAGREVCAISAFPLEDRVADGLEVVGSSRARRLTVYRLRALEDTTLLAVGRRLGLPLFRSAVKFGEAPVRVIAEGPFTCPHPREWLASEAVKSYSFETENGRTRLVLELVPGADTNVAADLLSEIGPIVCERFLVLPAD